MNAKTITIDIILVLVTIGAIVSFFYNPLGGDMKYLQILMGSIIGYFLGTQQVPVLRGIK